MTRDSKVNKMKETKNRHDDWNNWDESCFQNGMTDGHRVELTDGHKSRNDKIWDNNWIQNKMMGCHKS